MTTGDIREQSPVLIIHLDGERPAVSFTPDGEITFHEGYEATPACRAFWECLAKYNPLRSRVAELEAGIARYLGSQRREDCQLAELLAPAFASTSADLSSPSFTECDACAGTGRYGFRDDDECMHCHGSGQRPTESWPAYCPHGVGDASCRSRDACATRWRTEARRWGCSHEPPCEMPETCAVKSAGPARPTESGTP